jgi:hypothetical protein
MHILSHQMACQGQTVTRTLSAQTVMELGLETA